MISSGKLSLGFPHCGIKYGCSFLDDQRRTGAEGKNEFWERKAGSQESGLQLGIFKVPQPSKSTVDLPNPVKYRGFTEAA